MEKGQIFLQSRIPVNKTRRKERNRKITVRQTT